MTVQYLPSGSTNSPMDQQPDERARENPEHDHVPRHPSASALLENSKAKPFAFGILFVVYACMMCSVPLLARYPDQASQLLRLSLRFVNDWRLWTGVSTLAVVLAIGLVVLKRRTKTPH